MSAQPLTHNKSPQYSNPNHFLDLKDLNKNQLRDIVELAKTMKLQQQGRQYPMHPAKPLAGKSVALIFSKPSTRTRVSFEIGVLQLGGNPIVLSTNEMQIGRGETIADTARVLSRFVDGMVLRTGCTNDLMELAHYATVPVINGLTPDSHPCQVIADVITFEEHNGPIKGQTLAWLGDGNNVANSLIEAAVQFDFNLKLATPPNFTPSKNVLEWAQNNNANIILTNDPAEAVKDADAVLTDTWMSMSDNEGGRQTKLKIFANYQVNEDLMKLAKKHAIFMHCLPAHTGEEVTKAVFEGNQSVVFDEAENRLHAHKAILMWSLMGDQWKTYTLPK